MSDDTNNAEAKRALERAVADGVDLSLLRESLRRSPTERLRWHERALEFVLEVRRAGAARRHAPDRSPH